MTIGVASIGENINAKSVGGQIGMAVGVAGNVPAITSDGGGPTATVDVIVPSQTVTTVTATGDAPITFSISGGADAALFAINSSSGVLTFAAASSAGTYHVTVAATNFWGADTQAITVEVGVVPVITSNGGGPTASIGVTSPATAVTTVTATGTATITYSKSGADTLLFSIDGSTGVLAFLVASVPGTYHVTVTATNTWGHDDQALTVTVS